MKILLVHNRYKQSGGEDSVFQKESDLLLSYGNEVNQVVYDNATIKTFLDKVLSGFKTIYNPDSARAIRKEIEKFNPDVVHIHNFLPLVSPSVFYAARRSGVPVILTLHNYRLICPSATLFYKGKIYERSIRAIFPIDAIFKGVYRNSQIQTATVALMIAIHSLIGTWRTKVNCYIILTRFAKEKFVHSRLSLPKEKLFVKSNFVTDDGKGFPNRENFFLFIGRLTEEKGIHTLLNAANLHDFKLVIIGEGPLQDLVEEETKKNPNITYLGFKSKLLVMNYLKRCSALIFPSIWYEGFPMTILEAFSAGTPVISSDLGGMKEIIQDKVNGIHFKSGNEKDLVLKIMELSKDKALAQRISEGARLCYLEHYTPSINYNQLMGIYSTVIRNYKNDFKLSA